VKKYLSVEGGALPPLSPSRAGTQPQVIEPFRKVIDGWLRADPSVKGSVIHERLVADLRLHRALPAGQDVSGPGTAAADRLPRPTARVAIWALLMNHSGPRCQSLPWRSASGT